MTNSTDWKIPDGTSELTLAETWTVEDASEVVVGSISGGNSMTTGAVSFGAATPEPGSFALLSLGLAMCGLRRRRPIPKPGA